MRARRWRMVLLAVTLVLGACTAPPPPPLPSPSPSPSPTPSPFVTGGPGIAAILRVTYEFIGSVAVSGTYRSPSPVACDQAAAGIPLGGLRYAVPPNLSPDAGTIPPSPGVTVTYRPGTRGPGTFGGTSGGGVRRFDGTILLEPEEGAGFDVATATASPQLVTRADGSGSFSFHTALLVTSTTVSLTGTLTWVCS